MKEPIKILIVGDGGIGEVPQELLDKLATDFEVDIVQILPDESLKGLETMCFDEILSISDNKSDLLYLFSELEDALDDIDLAEFSEGSVTKGKHSHPHWHKGRW